MYYAVIDKFDTLHSISNGKDKSFTDFVKSEAIRLDSAPYWAQLVKGLENIQYKLNYTYSIRDLKRISEL